MAIHIAAILAAMVTTLPVLVKLLSAGFVAASLAYHLKQSNSPGQLVWRNGNRWFIDKEQLPAEMISIDFFSRWLVIITLQKPSSGSLLEKLRNRQKFIIPFDALSEDSFRLLRVRLRIEGYELLNPPKDEIK